MLRTHLLAPIVAGETVHEWIPAYCASGHYLGQIVPLADWSPLMHEVSALDNPRTEATTQCELRLMADVMPALAPLHYKPPLQGLSATPANPTSGVPIEIKRLDIGSLDGLCTSPAEGVVRFRAHWKTCRGRSSLSNGVISECAGAELERTYLDLIIVNIIANYFKFRATTDVHEIRINFPICSSSPTFHSR